MLTHFSLFTGIGGIDLAAEWAGFKTVGQCEWADYPTKVLEKHWPNVPRWRDIRDVTLESVRDRGIRTIDLISGGFPCQPFSVAGKQGGKKDDRYLWPEMLRVIKELRPRWVIGENVAGIVRMALDQVLFDLEGEGYTTIPFIIPACGVDAPHRRERVFIIAHANDSGNRTQEYETNGNGQEGNERREEQSQCGSSGLCENVANTNSEWQLQPQGSFGEISERISDSGKNVADTTGVYVQRFHNGQREKQSRGSGWWEVEPDVGRVVDGFSARVDRLKCLGNAVVPQQVYPILQAIAEIENNHS